MAIENHMDEDQQQRQKRDLTAQDTWPLYRYRWWIREYVAEFFGSFFLLSFGIGVTATTTFHAGNTASFQTNVSYLAITLGWGFGLAIALFITMGVSGGHLNPAVTLANCAFGAFPWRKAPGFMLAQLLGAILDAANVYGLFKQHFDDAAVMLLPNETMASKFSGVFVTYPNVSNVFAVWSEIFNTMVLMMGILAINDNRMTPADGYKPVAVGLLLFVIGITTGINSGYALNPTRDLGPRIFTAMLWGKEPFILHGYYFWIPIVGPIAGALLGMFLYVFCIIPSGA
uniref:Aquaglyceroporin 1 n=1 Tax=Leishmania guyanensis TaxID=5670 RepID=A0A060KZ28_LEIGU|nr:aquaglyceroporin 1 [Leishmania guyanensis]